jgi:hypothetical protein
MSKVRAAAVLLALAALLAPLAPAAAYGPNPVDFSMWSQFGLWATEAPENTMCVSASAVTMVNYMSGNHTASAYSHATYVVPWYNQAKGTGTSTMHTRYYYPSFHEVGLDPRAWAWLMWQHTGPGYAYHDYYFTDSGSPSQYTANYYMADQLYRLQSANQPVGALTDNGHHAVAVVGFRSTDWPAQVSGFYVVDPYASQARKNYYSGWIGDAPGSYLDITTWNTYYFTYYYDEGLQAAYPNGYYWKNQYVVVLRSKNDSPQPTPTNDAMPPIYGYTSAPSVAIAATSDAVSDQAYSSIENATLIGISSNGLSNDPSLAVDLRGAQIGRQVHVDSLDPAVPAYELVEVKSGGAVAAVAMIVDRPDGYHFGALSPVESGWSMPDGSGATTRLRQDGIDVKSMKLVWGASDESSSPFGPIWQATDASGVNH